MKVVNKQSRDHVVFTTVMVSGLSKSLLFTNQH